MLKTNKIQILVINNPFDRDDTVALSLEAEGKSLRALLDEVNTECLVSVNGKIIDENKWSQVIPVEGDKLAISVIPAGGDGGGKDILRIAAMIALTYFTFGAGGAAFWSSGFGQAAFAAQSAAYIGGSLLINKVLPPMMPELPDSSLASSPSQTYGIDGPKNTSRDGIPVPIVFGGYRMAANFINTRTLNDGDGQRLFLLVNAGEGEIAGISDIRINNEAYTSFDATVHTRLGKASQEVIEEFNDANNDTSINITLEDTGDDMTYTTTTPTTRLELDLVCSSGLYKLNNEGEYSQAAVTLMVHYRQKDSTSKWVYTFEDEDRIPTLYVKAFNRTGERFEIMTYVRSDRIEWVEGFNESSVEDYDEVQLWFHSTVNSNGSEPGEDRDYETVYRLMGLKTGEEPVILGTQTGNEAQWYTNADGIRLFGKSPSAERFTIASPVIDLDHYEFEVYRVTEKPDNEDPDRRYTIANAVTVSNFREFRGLEGIAYNNTALLGVIVRIDNQLTSVPTITYHNEGILIPVYRRDPNKPSEFTFTLEPSSNPAWIVHAMYTNQRWGARRGHDRLIMEEFYEWAQLCDEQGWKFHGVFDSEMNIFEAARAVAKVGRAKVIPIGTKYGVTVQHSQQMTQLFTSSLISEETLELSWLPTTERANVIDCTFYDKENDNKPRTFRYYNETLIEKGHPFRAAELTLFGVDNYEQAVKECEFALNYNQLSQTVTFEVPATAISCRVGQVAGLQHELPAWGVGGRLETGSTKRIVKLDREVTMEAGKEHSVLIHFNSRKSQTLSVHRLSADPFSLSATAVPDKDAQRIVIEGQDFKINNTFYDDDNNRHIIVVDKPVSFVSATNADLYHIDTVETRKVKTVEGRSDTLLLADSEDDFTAEPQALMQFSFGENNKQIKKFIVTDISGSGVEMRTISGLEYYEEVFQNGLVEELANFSDFPQQIQPIEGINVRELVYGGSTDKKLKLVVNWQYSAGNTIQKANVYLRRDDADGFSSIGKGVNTFAEVTVQEGESSKFDFEVIPLDAMGTEIGSSKATISHDISTNLEVPPVNSLVGTLIRDSINLYWQKGTSPYYGDAMYRYDIYRAYVTKGVTPVFPDDYTLYDSTMEKFATIEQLPADKDCHFVVIAVNPLNIARKSAITTYSITTPEVFSNRTSNSGIEIWYSTGVAEGATLGNPDTHPENWLMEFVEGAVVQAVLTWSNFTFQKWAVTALAADSVGMNYLGAFANYPSEPEEGDMFLYTVNNGYYIRRSGSWELFLDRNVSGLSTEYSPNGEQNTSDADYNWSSSFRSGVDKFMRQSTDSGSTWSQSILIVGEEGKGGRYRDYRFTRSVDVPALVKSDVDPDGWHQQPPNGVNPVWMIVVEKNPDGSFYDGQWGDPTRISGIDGQDGEVPVTYKIGYPNGTAIKNGQSNVTLEVRKVDESGSNVLTGSGDPQLYDGTTALGRSKTFSAADIDGSKVIKLKSGNFVADSITLVDVTDGVDAVSGSMSHNNTLSWVRAKNNGAWSPSQTNTTITVKFYRSGAEIASRTLTASLNSTQGQLTVSGSSQSGEATSFQLSGNGTPVVTLVATHNASGATVTETFHALQGGDNGENGNPGQQGNDGITPHIMVLDNDNVAIPADSLGQPIALPDNTVTIMHGNVIDTANWDITANATGVTGTFNNNSYQVSSLNSAFGRVTFTATRNGFATLEKTWTITRINATKPIQDGKDIIVDEGHDWLFSSGNASPFTPYGYNVSSGLGGVVRLESESTNPRFTSPTLSNALGSDNYAIVARVRCISSSIKLTAQCYYRNANHTDTNDYVKEIVVEYQKSEWLTLAFDMRELTHGNSSDYLNNNVDHFRIDFGDGNGVMGETFEVDYIAIGRFGVNEKFKYTDPRISNDELTLPQIQDAAGWRVMPEDGATSTGESSLVTDPTFEKGYILAASANPRFYISETAGEFSSHALVMQGANRSTSTYAYMQKTLERALSITARPLDSFKVKIRYKLSTDATGVSGMGLNLLPKKVDGSNVGSYPSFFKGNELIQDGEWHTYECEAEVPEDAVTTNTAQFYFYGSEGFTAGSLIIDTIEIWKVSELIDNSRLKGSDIKRGAGWVTLPDDGANKVTPVGDSTEGRFTFNFGGVNTSIDVFTSGERAKLNNLRLGKNPDGSKVYLDTNLSLLGTSGQGLIDGRANARVNALRPDASYRNDRILPATLWGSGTYNLSWVKNHNSETPPTGEAGKVIITSLYGGNGFLHIKAYDAEGGIRVSLNGTQVGTMDGYNEETRWYSFKVSNLVKGNNTVYLWAKTGDGGNMSHWVVTGGSVGDPEALLASSAAMVEGRANERIGLMRPVAAYKNSNLTQAELKNSANWTTLPANGANKVDMDGGGAQGQVRLRLNDGNWANIDAFNATERAKLDRLRLGKMPLDSNKSLIDSDSAQGMANTAEANAKKIKASGNLMSISDPVLGWHNTYTKKNQAYITDARTGGDTWRYQHGEMLEVSRATSTNSGEQDNIYYKENIPVQSGERYCFQVKIATHRVAIGLYVKVVRRDHSSYHHYVLRSDAEVGNKGTGHHREDYTLVSTFFDIPADAAYITPMIMMRDGTAASSSSYIFAIEWALNRVATGSNDVPEYEKPSPRNIGNLGYIGALDANKVALDGGGAQGQFRYQLNDGSWVNTDVFNSTERAKLDRLRQGKMPLDSSKSLIDVDSAQYRIDTSKQETIAEASGMAASGGILHDPTFEGVVKNAIDPAQYFIIYGDSSRTYVYEDGNDMIVRRGDNNANDSTLIFKDGFNNPLRIKATRGDRFACRIDFTPLNGGNSLRIELAPRNISGSGTTGYHDMITAAMSNSVGSSRARLEGVAEVTDDNTRYVEFSMVIPKGASQRYFRIHSIQFYRVTDSTDNSRLTEDNIKSGANWSTLPANGANKVALDSGGAQGQFRYQLNDGSWVNADVFNSTERQKLDRLRAGNDPVSNQQIYHKGRKPTSSDVGLGNVPNVVPYHASNKPSKSDVGLGNVPNWTGSYAANYAVDAAKNDDDLVNSSGDGINRFPAEFANPVEGVPVSDVIRGSVTLASWNGDGIPSQGNAIYHSATANDAYFYFSRTNQTPNINIHVASKWIVSAWIKEKSGNSSWTGTFYFKFKDSGGNWRHQGASWSSPSSYSWKRVSCVIDMTSTYQDRNLARDVLLRIDNEGGNGSDIIIDQVMIERVIKDGSKPSSYALPAGKSFHDAQAAMPTNTTVGAGAAVSVDEVLSINVFNTSSITVKAHILYVAGRDVSYSLGSVSGLQPETRYWICCDDPYLRGGNVTYYALNAAQKHRALNENGRRFIGSITTPTSDNQSPRMSPVVNSNSKSNNQLV